MSAVASVPFTDYSTSVTEALDLIGARERLPQRGRIVLKPNLTNADPPPVTTDILAVRAVYDYCRRHTRAEILVGEGSGTGETEETFRANGYRDWAERAAIRLVDFDRGPTVRLSRGDTFHLDEFHLPEVLVDAFVISIPVLKDHTITTTTIALKNMFGIAPGPVYGGTFNKSRLHAPSTAQSIVDVCLYKAPDLSVVDAGVGLRGGHLGGTPTAFGRILAGWDPVAVDAVGSRLLGHDPARIDYLRLAEGRLGTMRDLRELEPVSH